MGNTAGPSDLARENPFSQWMKGPTLGAGGKGSLPTWAPLLRVSVLEGLLSSFSNEKKI